MAAQTRSLPPARSTSALERQRAEAKAMVPEDEKPVKGEPGGPRDFEYDGVTYTIDDVGDWDVRVMLGIEDGHMFVAIRELLGAAQWALFMSKKRTNKDFYALSDAIFAGDEGRAE